jgi:predicted esterase YcpF (UPF0227 family)
VIDIAPELARPSERLVVAFGGIRHKLGGMQGEFYRSLEGLDCAAIFVRDTALSWYQYDVGTIDAAARQIRRIAAKLGTRRLVCIGNSMGGFGAILLGERVAADAILAVVPQTAIDPRVTDVLGDQRWWKYQRRIPSYPFGDLLDGNRPQGRLALCWGTDEALDCAHADRLVRAWAPETVIVEGAGHDAAGQLRQAGKLRPLLEDVITG